MSLCSGFERSVEGREEIKCKTGKTRERKRYARTDSRVGLQRTKNFAPNTGAAQRKRNNVNSCTLMNERYLGVTWRSTKCRDRLFRDCDKVTQLYSFFVRTVYRTRVILSRYGKEFWLRGRTSPLFTVAARFVDCFFNAYASISGIVESKIPGRAERARGGEGKHSGAEGEAGAGGGGEKKRGGDLLKPERMYYIDRFLLHSRWSSWSSEMYGVFH